MLVALDFIPCLPTALKVTLLFCFFIKKIIDWCLLRPGADCENEIAALVNTPFYSATQCNITPIKQFSLEECVNETHRAGVKVLH